MVYAGWYEIAS